MFLEAKANPEVGIFSLDERMSILFRKRITRGERVYYNTYLNNRKKTFLGRLYFDKYLTPFFFKNVKCELSDNDSNWGRLDEIIERVRDEREDLKLTRYRYVCVSCNKPLKNEHWRDAGYGARCGEVIKDNNWKKLLMREEQKEA